jgi:hypothetical protein
MTSSKIIMWIALVVLLTIIGPFITVWALNALFPLLAIPYTLETWAAMVILQVVLRSKIETKA